MTSLYGREFFAGRSPTVIRSADVVAPIIHTLFAPSSVLDVGCGKGEWMSAFSALGASVFGVDIAAPDGDLYLCHDLTTHFDLGRTFDLAVCLEVGEHLPEDAADTLVDSLVRHSDRVLFSAAVVGQEGVGHINCQPHEYWHDKFAARGYAMDDPVRPLMAGDQRVSPWYRDNIFVYEAAA